MFSKASLEFLEQSLKSKIDERIPSTQCEFEKIMDLFIVEPDITPKALDTFLDCRWKGPFQRIPPELLSFLLYNNEYIKNNEKTVDELIHESHFDMKTFDVISSKFIYSVFTVDYGKIQYTSVFVVYNTDMLLNLLEGRKYPSESRPVLFHMCPTHPKGTGASPVNDPFPAWWYLCAILKSSIIHHHTEYAQKDFFSIFQTFLWCTDITVPQMYGNRNSCLYSLMYLEMVLMNPPNVNNLAFLEQYASYDERILEKHFEEKTGARCKNLMSAYFNMIRTLFSVSIKNILEERFSVAQLLLDIKRSGSDDENET